MCGEHLYWLLRDGEKVRSDLLMFGMGIALPPVFVQSAWSLEMLSTWHECVCPLHRHQHPALSILCYSAVCTGESISSDFFASVLWMLETDEALCWGHGSKTDYDVEEAVVIWRNGQWLENSSCDDITLFTSRSYLADWPTDWMTDQPAD